GAPASAATSAGASKSTISTAYLGASMRLTASATFGESNVIGVASVRPDVATNAFSRLSAYGSIDTHTMSSESAAGTSDDNTLACRLSLPQVRQMSPSSGRSRIVGALAAGETTATPRAFAS